MQVKNYVKKAPFRFAAGILTVILLFLSLVSCGCTEIFEREVLSKEQLAENISGEDGGFDTVGRYLYEWDFPTFNDEKFLAVEKCVEAYYCGEMPDKHEVAVTCGNLFLEYFYDGVNLKSSSEVTDALLTCYMASFGDDFASYRNADAYGDFKSEMSGEEKFVGVGIRTRKSLEGLPYIVSVINGSPAELAGLKRGDVIVEVDGFSASEEGEKGYEKTVSRISGLEGETVSITVERAGKRLTFTPERRAVGEASVIYSLDEATGYGLVEILSFKENTDEDFKAAIDALVLAGVRGIIFDLRNNLGGILPTVVNMVSYLVDDGLPVVSYQCKNSPEVRLNSGNDGHAVKLPMVVITNELTASAAEIFAASLRDYELMEGVELDVTIVGKKSLGKGVMQRVYSFSDGSAVAVTVAYYNPPLGINYHGVGVMPDDEVEDALTASGGDAQLLAAFEAMGELLGISSEQGISN